MEEKNRALLIVDVQPTFCEGGALGVTGGNATAERIADFVTENAGEYDLIVTTQDWHIKPGAHFSDHPDFVDTWPPHGMADTPEAELHEAIASLPIDESVKKGQYSGAYSGFEGKNADGESLEDILRSAEIEALDIVGIAESHCVKETALDGVKKGWPVRVFSDLTVPVSEELGRAARQEMDEAGVDQIPSTEAFGFYEEGEDTPIPGDDADLDDFGGASFFGAGTAARSASSPDDYYEDDYGDGDADDFAVTPDGEEEFNLSNFDDLDLEADLDSDLDAVFGADMNEADFDFSDIDLNKELG